MLDWLEYDANHVISPAFGNQTQALARQQHPSIQSVRTGVITWDTSIENSVQNLNLSSGDGISTITGDDLWRRHDPQTLSQAFDFFGRLVKVQDEGKTSLKIAVQQILIELTKPCPRWRDPRV